jgi:thiol-disulfide isomerase/thioredoxin
MPEVSPPRPRRVLPRRVLLRWAGVVLVLVVATVVALWPRHPATSAGPAGGAAQPAGPDLVALRARAALPPCVPAVPAVPAPAAAGVAGPAGPLAGVRASCLADGSSVDLGALLGGRPALINMWAQWCQPCRQELPAIAAYAARPGALPVLTVQVDGPPEAGLDMLGELGVRLLSVTDQSGAVRAALPTPALPTSYVALAGGQVRRVVPEPVFGSADQVDTVVRQYLAGGDHG